MWVSEMPLSPALHLKIPIFSSDLLRISKLEYFVLISPVVRLAHIRTSSVRLLRRREPRCKLKIIHRKSENLGINNAKFLNFWGERLSILLTDEVDSALDPTRRSKTEAEKFTKTTDLSKLLVSLKRL